MVIHPLSLELNVRGISHSYYGGHVWRHTVGLPEFAGSKERGYRPGP
jgi:hypothetical protein